MSENFNLEENVCRIIFIISLLIYFCYFKLSIKSEPSTVDHKIFSVNLDLFVVRFLAYYLNSLVLAIYLISEMVLA